MDEPVLERVIGGLTLVDASVREMVATRESSGTPDAVQFDLESGWAFQDELLSFRIRESVQVKQGEVVLGSVAAAAILAFAMSAPPSDADQKAFAEAVMPFAQMIAHPHIRAALALLAGQVGLGPVTVGLLRQGSAHPDNVTVGQSVFTLDDAASD